MQKQSKPDPWFALIVDSDKEYHHQPDHWLGNTFAPGHALEPITGIRTQDAVAFCKWLNTRDPSKKSRYRLPRPEEAIQYPAVISEVATWCYDGNKFGLVGLNDETTQLILKQLNDFTGAKLPQFIVPYFTKEGEGLIEYHFGFNEDRCSWDYQKIQISHLRGVLQPVLGLFYGTPGRDLLIATSYDIAHAQAIAYSYKLACSRDLLEDITTYQTQVRDYSFDLSGFTDIATAIKNHDLELAQNLVKRLAVSQNTLEKRWANLLQDFLSLINAQNMLELRRAYHHYTAHLALFAYIGFVIRNILENESKVLTRPLSKALLEAYCQEQLAQLPDVDFMQWNYGITGSYEEYQKVMLTLYWQMQILMAREAGKLISWEGIRLVREN